MTIVEALPRLVPAEDEFASKPLERAFRKRKIAFKTGVRFTGRQADRRRGHGVARVRRGPRGRPAARRRRPRARHRRRSATRRQGVDDGARLRPHRRAAAHQPRRTSTPSATSSPASSSPTAASSRASSSPRTSPGSNPPVIDETGIPRVTYCDPEVASVGLTEAQAREQLRRRGRDADLRPRRQRQEPDPEDPGLRQARPGARHDGPGRRRPHGRRPGRRADRRGPADLQLGGVPRGRRRRWSTPTRPRTRPSARPTSRWPASRCTPTPDRPRTYSTEPTTDKERHVHVDIRQPCPPSVRASPRAPSPAGSSRRATRSRSTSRCSRSPPTRSTPRSPRRSPACCSEIVAEEDETVEVGGELAVIGDDGRVRRRGRPARPSRSRGAGRRAEAAEEPRTQEPRRGADAAAGRRAGRRGASRAPARAGASRQPRSAGGGGDAGDDARARRVASPRAPSPAG